MPSQKRKATSSNNQVSLKRSKLPPPYKVDETVAFLHPLLSRALGSAIALEVLQYSRSLAQYDILNRIPVLGQQLKSSADNNTASISPDVAAEERRIRSVRRALQEIVQYMDEYSDNYAITGSCLDAFLALPETEQASSLLLQHCGIRRLLDAVLHHVRCRGRCFLCLSLIIKFTQSRDVLELLTTTACLEELLLAIESGGRKTLVHCQSFLQHVGCGLLRMDPYAFTGVALLFSVMRVCLPRTSARAVQLRGQIAQTRETLRQLKRRRDRLNRKQQQSAPLLQQIAQLESELEALLS